MKTLPMEVEAVLQQNGLDREQLIYWMVCDRSTDGSFADTYLLLGREALVIVSSGRPPSLEKNYKGFFVPKKEQKAATPVPTGPWSKETMKLSDLEAISVVNLVASGMIVIKEKEGERIVAAFTNGHMARAAKLASAFKKLKKNEALDPQELDESQETSSCPKCGMIYPEKGRQICPKCLKKHAIFLRLLSFSGAYKTSIFFIVLFMLLNSATGLVIPYLQGTVLFDQALGGKGTFAGKIGLVILLIIAFRTLSLLFGVLFGVMISKLAANVSFDLKTSVFSAMQRLSLHFFQRKQTGQLMTRVNNDATELQYFFVDGMSYFIVNAMNIIGITVVLLVMDWKLTLLCFLPMPLVFVIVRKVFPRLWRLSWRRHRKVSALNSIISDTMRGTRVVKSFGKEQEEIARFHKANVSFSESEQMVNKLGGTVFPVLNLLTQTGGLLIWAFGGWMVMKGQFSFGQVMTFVGYMHMLYGPIQFMNNIVNWWSRCMSAAQRIFEIQDTVPDVAEKADAIHLEELRGEIRVSNVVFGYEPNKAILKGVSMEARPGQMIGVVGHSGAGKSTLVNLISRLYDVTEGEIRIDGINVKDLTTASLRRNIGIVSQDVYVFSGSIAENIAYANPDCTIDDIIYAAKIANAHDYIEKLPDGYDTIVGTGGHNLSGGEKQRLSIARAILYNPKILILDEATASLDTETELQIQDALDSLIKGRTTIAIAHRLSTLRNADYLVVMDQGKVVEAGTHDELMSKEGEYCKLVKKHDEALKMKEGIIA
ncbi:ABC transporter transmembrane domain-containing protein [Paenibacillus allorhizosphaerae]|uniref:Vitamin B12 import ATP-binding protein BtuD n=1 Tax=Paenibacillus allorhizosphaerae TaxID=2849866 RepID=A0ABM8VHY6_9BACL|nr:ABC transporter ATP-binding protein [Paenibacillus allorhizosphaerae]CAG7643006.1 Vitamin B12 import ATP-binding protein BtuD [Paenibacillus allorhizosphaerae]